VERWNQLDQNAVDVSGVGSFKNNLQLSVLFIFMLPFVVNKDSQRIRETRMNFSWISV